MTDLFSLHITSMTFHKGDITDMPYFNEQHTHVYVCFVSILWSPLKIGRPKNSELPILNTQFLNPG